mmetsp:Transcript_91368/g.209359  ORF Transcript_91368/g.209359 Transcript_91368/m.209359 type:complete len:384 (-) Transcript_91368:208-1359(-)
MEGGCRRRLQDEQVYRRRSGRSEAEVPGSEMASPLRRNVNLSRIVQIRPHPDPLHPQRQRQLDRHGHRLRNGSLAPPRKILRFMHPQTLPHQGDVHDLNRDAARIHALRQQNRQNTARVLGGDQALRTGLGEGRALRDVEGHGPRARGEGQAACDCDSRPATVKSGHGLPELPQRPSRQDSSYETQSANSLLCQPKPFSACHFPSQHRREVRHCLSLRAALALVQHEIAQSSGAQSHSGLVTDRCPPTCRQQLQDLRSLQRGMAPSSTATPNANGSRGLLHDTNQIGWVRILPGCQARTHGLRPSRKRRQKRKDGPPKHAVRHLVPSLCREALVRPQQPHVVHRKHQRLIGHRHTDGRKDRCEPPQGAGLRGDGAALEPHLVV